MEIRGTDDFGSGAFGASRGGRKHIGADIVVEKGDPVRAFREGKVTKIGLPYSPQDPKKGHFRYVEIAVGNKRHRYFYVDPIVKAGQLVGANQIIGHAQGIASVYSTKTKTMTDHVHFEIRLPDNTVIDPTNMVKGFCIDKDKAFYAKRISNIISIYCRASGCAVFTGASTIKGAIEFLLNKAEKDAEFKVKPDAIDWSQVTGDE